MSEKEKETYPQKCGFCGYEWNSRKAIPKECPNCKRILVEGGVTSVETNKLLCEDFDTYLKVKGEFVFEPRISTKHVFRWENDKLHYQKFLGSVKVRDVICSSSYEIMKEWIVTAVLDKIK